MLLNRPLAVDKYTACIGVHGSPFKNEQESLRTNTRHRTREAKVE